MAVESGVAKKIPVRSPHFMRGALTSPWRNFYQWIINKLKEAAVAELYAAAESDIVVSTATTYVQWTGSTVGVESDALIIDANSTTDNITVKKDNTYNVSYSGSFEGTPGIAVYGAIFINGTISSKSIMEGILGTPESVHADTYSHETGVVNSGTVTDTHVQNGVYLDIQENGGATPVLRGYFTFTDPEEHASVFHFLGRYTGTSTHNVKLYAYNFTTTTWDAITATTTDLPGGDNADYDLRFMIGGTLSDYYNGSSQIQIRFDHTSSGNSGHQLLINKVAMCAPDAHVTLAYNAPYELDADDTVDFRLTTNHPITVEVESFQLNVSHALGGGKGDTGVQGPKGDTGDTGPTGPAGTTTAGAMDDLTDADTTTDTPNIDETLAWNGSNWVPTASGQSWVFAINGFSDGISADQLIGAGQAWKGTSTLTFTTSAYDNGPPSSASINIATNGTWDASAPASGTSGWTTDGTDTFNCGLGDPLNATLTADPTYYPASPVSGSNRITFTLTANSTYNATQTVDFVNTTLYGASSTFRNAHNQTSLDLLTENGASEDNTYSKTIDPGASDYVTIAYPSRLSDITQVRIGGISASFHGTNTTLTPDVTNTLAYENSNGYSETFKVICSTLQNIDDIDGLGDSVQTLISSSVMNHVEWGRSAKRASWVEADIISSNVGQLAGGGTSASNTTARSETITASGSNYLVFCYPSRLTDVAQVRIDGVTAAFNSTQTTLAPQIETVAIENRAGFKENYDIIASAITYSTNETITTSTSTSALNWLRIGVTSTTGSYGTSDIAGLSAEAASDDATRTWSSVVLSSEYLLIAIPDRVTAPSIFKDDDTGFALSLELLDTPNYYEVVAYTNEHGYTENYKVWRSENLITGTFNLLTE